MARTAKFFRSDEFRTRKEWIYFCLEYDLQICDGCFGRARRRESGVTRRSPWFCDLCHPPVHSDLLHALRTRENVRTHCHLCGLETSIRDCWISEDCMRVYCSRHLKPLRKSDRYRLTQRYLKRKVTVPREATLHEPIDRLRDHLQSVDCANCSFNATAIYDGNRLVEIDAGHRSCDCAPDTLNCAGIETEVPVAEGDTGE